jgi:hypothetical protein
MSVEEMGDASLKIGKCTAPIVELRLCIFY